MFPEARFPAIIDNTLRKDFASCPTKAFYAHFVRLGSVEPSIHLHFGGAFARGLEVTRKAFHGQGISGPEAERLGQEAIKQFWGEYDVEGNGTVKSLARCLSAHESYFLEYPLAYDHIKPYKAPDGSPGVEFTFALPLPIKHPETGDPLTYAGRFDMLGVFQDTLYVVDEKTSTALGASWGNQWDLASQFTGYCYAAQAFDYPVGGAIIRGVGLLKTQTTFAQHITYRPKWMLEVWYEQLLRDVERMVYYWEQYKDSSRRFDLNLGDACSAYGACPFRRLCLSPNPENWVSGYYAERHWNPLAQDAQA